MTYLLTYLLNDVRLTPSLPLITIISDYVTAAVAYTGKLFQCKTSADNLYSPD